MTRTHDIMTSLSASALTLTARLQLENSSLTLTSDLRQSHDAVSTMWPGGFVQNICTGFAEYSAHHHRQAAALQTPPGPALQWRLWWTIAA